MDLDIKFTYNENRLYIQSLIEQLGRAGSILPFVGAGLSIPSGLPGWRDFLKGLLEEGISLSLVSDADGGFLADKLERGHLEDVADHLWTVIGDNAFRDKLQHEFRIGGGRSIQGAVRHVPRLATNLILTTNYDRVVEDVWDEYLRQIGSSERVEQLLPTNRDDFARALTGVGRFVFKLHGDVERPETWILTKKSYTDRYDGKFAALPLFLQEIVPNYIPLFLGCSLQEERMFNAMRAKGTFGYAILPGKSDEQQRETTSRLRDHVKIIWLRPEDIPAGSNIYDLVEPLLIWVADRAQLGGKVVWPSEPRRQPSWDAELRGFESSGRYEDGLNWIIKNWALLKSWELAIQLLHFSDLVGKPEDGLSKYADVRESLRISPPSPENQHAIQYYEGRLLGQLGLVKQAIDQHNQNVSEEGVGDFFQLRSRFEIPQLLFRVEEFGESRKRLQELWRHLKGVKGQDRLATDALKFLGTFEIINIIYDLPFSPSVSLSWQAGNPEKCVEYSQLAYHHAELARYDDGKAWALAVKACGLEGCGKYQDAEEAYKSSFQVCASGACRRSSLSHIYIYYAGYHRRRGNLQLAENILNKALDSMPSKARHKDHARIYEERALIENLRGNSKDAADRLIEALLLYAKEPVFQWEDWPIVKRLRTTCADRGVEFDKFFEHGR